MVNNLQGYPSNKICKEITIVAFGDSITEAIIDLRPEQKWTILLEKKLNSYKNICWTVVNSGVGGNTSREGLARIQKDVISYKPDIVLVEFGGNDACPDKERAVCLKEYINNLDAISEKLVCTGVEVILLTFSPIVDDWHIFGDDEKYMNVGGLDNFIELYRKASREFAKEKDLKLIDIDVVLRKACIMHARDQIIMKDGVHLTAKANEIVSDAICNYLVSQLIVGNADELAKLDWK